MQLETLKSCYLDNVWSFVYAIFHKYVVYNNIIYCMYSPMDKLVVSTSMIISAYYGVVGSHGSGGLTMCQVFTLPKCLN